MTKEKLPKAENATKRAIERIELLAFTDKSILNAGLNFIKKQLYVRRYSNRTLCVKRIGYANLHYQLKVGKCYLLAEVHIMFF
jgi:hypothetical protein